jgi:hypothetical protein
MIHAHGSGWDDVGEIYDFADSVVKDAPQLPKVDRPIVNAETGKVHTKFEGELSELWVYYTNSNAAMKDRKWQFIETKIDGGEAISQQPLPKDATAFLVYGFRVIEGGHRNNHSSSVVIELEK